MAKYKVQSNGKAQAGLKAGDEVVTGGGTYRITGVNADGTYKSEKVSNETTSTYKGSYANSGGSSSGGSSGGGKSSNKNSQYTGYNYTIGSDLGKKTAQNMGIGQTWTATDGSEWYKENDGTITVKHGGQTYKNAYTPSDYSTLIKQQIDAGVPYQDVMNSMYARLGKASNDPSLSKYMYDDVYNQAWNYILENQGKENINASLDGMQNYMNGFEDGNPRPDAYQTDPRIDKLLDEILTREDFSYDAMNDPLYQQYREQYLREGDRAMRDTLAEVAAGAGGMNTYAITAAQQANNYYNSQLNDRVPELYQLAYQKYLADKASQVENLGLLQNMDATQYARYRDTMNDWYTDKNFAYGSYMDAVNQGNWQTNYNYDSMLNNRDFMNNNYWSNKEFDYNDSWTNKQWDASQEDKDYNRNQTEVETAKADIEWLIQNGVTTIRPELIERAGLTQEEVNQMITNYQKQQTLKSSSSGRSSSSSSRSSSGSTGDTGSGGNGSGYTDDDEGGSWTNAVFDLGLPATLDATTIEELALVGAVYDDKNGKTQWAQGWNAQNWEEKLKKIKDGPFMGLYYGLGLN